MDDGLTTERDYLLYLNETLFSLNLGLTLAIGLRVYLSQFPFGRNRLSDCFVRAVSGINGTLRLASYDRIGVNITFVALTGALALAVFSLSRLSKSIVVSRSIAKVARGIVALGALPTCWLYIESVLDPRSPPPWAIWFLSVAVAAICISLYSRDIWSIPPWATVFLLTLYFGFWGWMLLQHIGHDPFGFTLPLIGLCSNIVWGLFVRRQPTGA